MQDVVKSSEPSVATKSKLSMRLTRPGMWLMGVLAILLLMAMNYRNNANFLLFSVMGACTLVAMLEARRNLRGISVECEALLPVFADHHGHLLLRLRINDQRPRSLLRLDAAGQDCVLLEAEDGSIADIELPALPRGVHRIASCHLSSTHPFGLIRVSRKLPLDVELLVYPLARGDRPLPGDDMAGERGGEQQDFAGHRRYQPGDAPQHIDWKIAARSGNTMVKRFGGEHALHRHRLRLAQVADQDMESGLSQLCRWVCLAEEQHEPYSLDGAGHEPDLGPEHCHRCLEVLARHD